MRPDDRDFDEEIRGHLALSVRERVAAGEDPETARRAAIAELGSLLRTRESLRAVWANRWLEAADALRHDLRLAWRSLSRAPGLTAAVVATLALGIGANAAVFSVVRQVLLRPLVNRGEDRLVYVRQSAPGLGATNTAFSVPEIKDLRARARTIAAFGEFSTIDLTLNGLGEPRTVKAGLVDGQYFDVMGLRPALGRLLGPGDDRFDAPGVVVLTHRFWTSALHRDPGVLGRKLRLGTVNATIVGVLEPSLPYPADTEIIGNIVTSPHHLSAAMVTSRNHRMTDLFGRLADGATLDAARAELTTLHAAMMREHPEAYAPNAEVQLSIARLRDQIAGPARRILMLLLAVTALVFVVACTNVANLILARSVSREGELAVRAALGAGTAALRRTLLAESVLLCGGGAVLGVLLAGPLVTAIGAYASRFSVRAEGVTVDSTVLWTGAALAMLAAVILAFVPRLPSVRGVAGLNLASGSTRLAPATGRRLRVFAIAQVALSFVLLAAAGAILTQVLRMQSAETGYEMQRVLALDVPQPIESIARGLDFYTRLRQRATTLPGVERVAVGSFVPWRDAGSLMPALPFTIDGARDGGVPTHARLRNVTPGFFATLGVPLLAGRDFTDDDRRDSEPVVIVSHSVAALLFPDGSALGRHFTWTDPLLGPRVRRRIVGIVADVDDEHVVPGLALNVYHPLPQLPMGGRVFVHAAGDPYALVQPMTRLVRELAADQPVERAATLADVRAEILAPERLNAFVFGGFAAVGLLIATVGVAGVLAFSVSARTREFGVRLAIGASPARLLGAVIGEGAAIAAAGILCGAPGGYVLSRVASTSVDPTQLSGVLVALAAGAVLMAAATTAAMLPAARASRVDVVQALRSE